MGRVAADTPNSSNVTFTNIFTQAALASEKWSFEATIFFKSAATTTGLVTAVDAPAASVLQAGLVTGETATAWRTLPTTTLGGAMVGTAGLTTVLVAYCTGTVEVQGTPGNLVLKFRSEVNGSALTVMRGSFCKFMKHAA
jgi:hypothetical protein